MKVALGEHRFVGWDKDHLGIEIGADSGVIIEIGASRARNNQHTVVSVVVLGHA